MRRQHAPKLGYLGINGIWAAWVKSSRNPSRLNLREKLMDVVSALMFYLMNCFPVSADWTFFVSHS